MTLYTKLKDKYGDNNPFLLSEVKNDFSEYSYDSLRNTLSIYVKEDKLRRFDVGIYYFPKMGLLGERRPSIYEILEKKYLKIDGHISGFYTGLNLLNMVGQTTQVPNTIEITTNAETNIKRVIQIGRQKVILRRPLFEINDENYAYHQFMDIFRYADLFTLMADNDGVMEYIREKGLTKKKVIETLKYYPKRAFSYFCGSGNYWDAFRQE